MNWNNIKRVTTPDGSSYAFQCRISGIQNVHLALTRGKLIAYKPPFAGTWFYAKPGEHPFPQPKQLEHENVKEIEANAAEAIVLNELLQAQIAEKSAPAKPLPEQKPPTKIFVPELDYQKRETLSCRQKQGYFSRADAWKACQNYSYSRGHLCVPYESVCPVHHNWHITKAANSPKTGPELRGALPVKWGNHQVHLDQIGPYVNVEYRCERCGGKEEIRRRLAVDYVTKSYTDLLPVNFKGTPLAMENGRIVHYKRICKAPEEEIKVKSCRICNRKETEVTIQYGRFGAVCSRCCNMMAKGLRDEEVLQVITHPEYTGKKGAKAILTLPADIQQKLYGRVRQEEKTEKTPAGEAMGEERALHRVRLLDTLYLLRVPRSADSSEPGDLIDAAEVLAIRSGMKPVEDVFGQPVEGLVLHDFNRYQVMDVALREVNRENLIQRISAAIARTRLNHPEWKRQKPAEPAPEVKVATGIPEEEKAAQEADLEEQEWMNAPLGRRIIGDAIGELQRELADERVRHTQAMGLLDQANGELSQIYAILEALAETMDQHQDAEKATWLALKLIAKIRLEER